MKLKNLKITSSIALIISMTSVFAGVHSVVVPVMFSLSNSNDAAKTLNVNISQNGGSTGNIRAVNWLTAHDYQTPGGKSTQVSKLFDVAYVGTGELSGSVPVEYKATYGGDTVTHTYALKFTKDETGYHFQDINKLDYGKDITCQVMTGTTVQPQPYQTIPLVTIICN